MDCQEGEVIQCCRPQSAILKRQFDWLRLSSCGWLINRWPKKRLNESLRCPKTHHPSAASLLATAFNADLWPRRKCFGRRGPYPASQNRLYVFVNCSNARNTGSINRFWKPSSQHSQTRFCSSVMRSMRATTAQLQGEWNRLTDKPEFRRFRADVPVIATWDNHDDGTHGTLIRGFCRRQVGVH